MSTLPKKETAVKTDGTKNSRIEKAKVKIAEYKNELYQQLTDGRKS